MTDIHQSEAVHTDDEPAEAPETLTREQLYDLVWREPMLRIGERYRVSSSYLARICADLRVPRPQPGHWSKLEFGKSSPQPPLPAARPGDTLSWTRVDPPQPGERRLGSNSKGASASAPADRESPSRGESAVGANKTTALPGGEPATAAGFAGMASPSKPPATGTRRPGKRIPADAKHELVDKIVG